MEKAKKEEQPKEYPISEQESAAWDTLVMRRQLIAEQDRNIDLQMNLWARMKAEELGITLKDYVFDGMRKVFRKKGAEDVKPA